MDGNARGDGDAVAGRADGFLKISLGLAFLVAAGSAGYHYAVYIPTRDAQLDNERRFEKAHSEYGFPSPKNRISCCVHVHSPMIRSSE